MNRSHCNVHFTSQDAPYIEFLSLSYVETEDEVEENFNTFFLNIDETEEDYYSKKYYDGFVIHHNTEDRTFFQIYFFGRYRS